VTEAIVTRSITQASTFELTMNDEDRRFIRRLDLNRDSTLHFDGLIFQQIGVSKSGNSLTLSFESAAINDLRKLGTGDKAKPIKVRREVMTRSQFANRLVRESGWVRMRAEPGDKTKVGLHRGDRTDPGESNWDAVTRMADDRRWRAFESEGTIYFGSDAWLMTQGDGFTFSEEDEGINWIDFEADSGKRASSATVDCFARRWAARPGVGAQIVDMGPICSGKWLVESISRSVFSQRATVTLVRPQKALPEPEPSTLGGPGATNDKVYVPGGDMQQKVRAVFGANSQKALCIMAAESGGRKVYNGTCCYGPFQINAQAHGLDPQRLLNDEDYNLQTAYRISNGGRDWSAWTTNGQCGGP
jgi:hypothetical protein